MVVPPPPQLTFTSNNIVSGTGKTTKNHWIPKTKTKCSILRKKFQNLQGRFQSKPLVTETEMKGYDHIARGRIIDVTNVTDLFHKLFGQRRRFDSIIFTRVVDMVKRITQIHDQVQRDIENMQLLFSNSKLFNDCGGEYIQILERDIKTFEINIEKFLEGQEQMIAELRYVSSQIEENISKGMNLGRENTSKGLTWLKDLITRYKYQGNEDITWSGFKEYALSYHYQNDARILQYDILLRFGIDPYTTSSKLRDKSFTKNIKLSMEKLYKGYSNTIDTFFKEIN